VHPLSILCTSNGGPGLIYLSPEVQRKLIPLLHYSLTLEGILFLGSAETIGGFTELFVPPGGKWRLFRRMEVSFFLPRSTNGTSGLN
jgi:hypothetical protein